MTPERLAELHEAAKYAKSHGGGYVNINADELLEVLPALPVEEKAADPEAVAEVAAVPVPPANAPEVAGSGLAPEPETVASIPAAVSEGQKAPDSVDPGPLVSATQAAVPVPVAEAGDDPALDAQIEAGTDSN